MNGVVVLTRPGENGGSLRQALIADNFEVLDWPGIELAALEPEGGIDGLIAELNAADAIAFLSPGGVQAVRTILGDLERVFQAPAPPRIFAQGPGTAAALQALGCPAPTVARQHDAHGLAAVLLDALPQNRSVAIIAGSLSSGVVAKRLSAGGLRPTTLVVYDNRRPRHLARPERSVDCVIFASPSAARNHLQANPWLRGVPAIAIGNTTAAWLTTQGDHQHVITAQAPTASAMLDAVRRTIKDPR